MPFIVKVGLLIPDLSQFKSLNGEYVKFFGLKPPSRVCVQIPSDEIIAFFIVWNNNGKNDSYKIEEFK